MPCKQNGSFYYTYTLDKNKIIVNQPVKNATFQFMLFQSHYENVKFAGKLIWYESDKFVALCEGSEGLMLCDFIVDKEFINALH